MEWNQTYRGPNSDHANSVMQTVDGGYILAGSTFSFGDEGWDIWLVKTDFRGNHVWNHTYGGADSDCGYSVVGTMDGGFAIAGLTSSFGAGSTDFWLVKTDVSGNYEWSQTYGGANTDGAWAVVQTVDGGYALAGYSESFGVGGRDFLLVKTDQYGILPESLNWTPILRVILFLVIIFAVIIFIYFRRTRNLERKYSKTMVR
jgi:hypothetical protein